ncbi:transketolase [Kamptonema cortianum]|nr:transketolase [Geitlerinema splendidum]MDK3161152.1 transketolase [Kamptonema cortianum]
MSATKTSLDQLAINTLRMLSVDMVEQANSGHPGLPLGAAPMAYALFAKVMKYDPAQPNWADRDRFILSAGHGSALLYSCLHLFGFDLPLRELQQFRQLGSKTPGHPEVGLTHGVECTTGPLGQGFANGVGMALAERWMASRYNTPNAKVVDHYTYAIVSDGDLMEGVAQEAASFAGHQKLGKLIYLYDSNAISLDGPCEKAFTEDTAKKFEAMGWQVLHVSDGNDVDSIVDAIKTAQSETTKPSLIIVTTIIGYGSPLAGSSKSHGAPLGSQNVLETKKTLSWEHENPFTIPAEVLTLADEARIKGSKAGAEWDLEFEQFHSENESLASEFKCLCSGGLPDGWANPLDKMRFEPGSMATRDAGKNALNALATTVPWLIGGGADLASSTKTVITDGGDVTESNPGSRNIWFGVREHAMGAIVNGMALHGLRPFGSTFLVFSDYMRGSIRLASLSHIPSLFIFTHDSVFVGEDGPTHQPIEHVESLRLIPELKVFRPADAIETAQCYKEALVSNRASCLVLTRQNVPTLVEYAEAIKQGVSKGGYVLKQSSDAKITLVASGSEVSLALEAESKLRQKGIAATIVSLPCQEVFGSQSQEYRDSVIPPSIPSISLEAGVTNGWAGILSGKHRSLGINRFGESGPGSEVYQHLGMTADAVVSLAEELLG